MKSTTLRKLLSCSQKRFISRGSILRGSESPQSWAPGKELHGFRVDRVQEIPELQLTAIQMQHLKTGSLHLHLQKDADANSVFRYAPSVRSDSEYRPIHHGDFYLVLAFKRLPWIQREFRIFWNMSLCAEVNGIQYAILSSKCYIAPLPRT